MVARGAEPVWVAKSTYPSRDTLTVGASSAGQYHCKACPQAQERLCEVQESHQKHEEQPGRSYEVAGLKGSCGGLLLLVKAEMPRTSGPGHGLAAREARGHCAAS